ncbi:MAG: Crp/Fnr family transcriptional regulator [Pyrinomonadaceae bacterium]
MPLLAPPPNLKDNRLLTALSEEEYRRISPHLESVCFKLGETIYERGAEMEYVYFPLTAVVSLLYVTENGKTAKIGLVGNEGVFDIALFMGSGPALHQSYALSAGEALRMKAGALQNGFKRGGDFQRMLLRYVQALVIQISQTAVCYRLHSVEQQLCCWLLLSYDRSKSNELIMTHELIANMLGTRREGVTVAAGRLQDAGLISYHRGHIKILDRKGLKATACECYAFIKSEYDRLLC